MSRERLAPRIDASDVRAVPVAASCGHPTGRQACVRPDFDDRVVRRDLRGELGEFLALLDLHKTLGVLEPAPGEYPYKTAPMS
jgi:hypothetical protein